MKILHDKSESAVAFLSVCLVHTAQATNILKTLIPFPALSISLKSLLLAIIDLLITIIIIITIIISKRTIITTTTTTTTKQQ